MQVPIPPKRSSSLFIIPPLSHLDRVSPSPSSNTQTPTTTQPATTGTPASSTSKQEGPREQVVAMWDYDGETASELSFKEGDILTLLEKMGEGSEWWVGELNGKTGHFPKDYVRAYSENEAQDDVPDDADASAGTNTIAHVLYDYKALTDSEIDVGKGDEVVVLQKKLKGGWTKISLSNKVGHVPSSYLHFTDEVPKKLSSVGKGRALWAFEAKSNTELSFNKGDEVSILKRLDGSWWLGELNGNVGHFPKSYITEDLTDTPASKQPDADGPPATPLSPSPTPAHATTPPPQRAETAAPVESKVVPVTQGTITLEQISALIEKATQPLIQDIAKLRAELEEERKARKALAKDLAMFRGKRTGPPAEGNHAAKQPTTKEPAAKDPAKEPVAKEPVAKEPVAKELAVKEPTTKEPSGNSPTLDTNGNIRFSMSMGESQWRLNMEAFVNKVADDVDKMKRKVDKLADSADKPEPPFKPSSLRSTGSRLY